MASVYKKAQQNQEKNSQKIHKSVWLFLYFLRKNIIYKNLILTKNKKYL